MRKHNQSTSDMYTCPMHPNVKRQNPGICPECGMTLVPASPDPKPSAHNAKHGNMGENSQSRQGYGESHNQDGGFNKHEGHKTNVFKIKFWVSFVLSIPVVAYSEIVQKLLDWQAPVFFGSMYVPAILSTIIFFYGGWVFIVAAYREIRAGMPGMMTLISLAIFTAFIYSIVTTFIGGQTLFWELATLITIMLLGHWMEMRAVSGAQGALKELSKLLPDKAEVIRGGKTITVSLEDVISGDLVLIKPGGKVPADGIIIEGESELDESLATGESKPVEKTVGSEVIAGTINGDGSLTVKVTKVGEDTFLAGVKRLVIEAQSSKSKLQLLSDKAAYYLTIVAVVTGGVTLASWLAASDTAFAIERMVAVLVIACPHALGLAIPLVASISTTKAAKNGFLVKQRMALEAARNIDAVLFDKTGTLTKGEFGISAIVPSEGVSEEEVLLLGASINNHSEHPIAKAIVKEAKNKGISISQIKNFKRIAGKGAEAEIDGKKVLVGSPTLVKDLSLSLDEELDKRTTDLSRQGKTVVYVISENRIIGAIALADMIRQESREAVKSLHDLGIKTAMITGDSEDVAKWVAEELGIDEYFAKVLPEQKSEKVKLLQSDGRKVAMVGDGINDAPALVRADLGIAIGAGTNVAIESAGIILVKDDPRDIVKIIRLSKLTYKKMIQNLWWAAGYNIVAIPLAAGVLAFKGIFLQPALAAVFMSLSTVIVAINASLLRNKKL